MLKAASLLAITFLLLILVLSSIALHIQAFVINGYHVSDAQLGFPAVLMPVTAAFRGHSVSLALIIAAAVAAGIHRPLFRRFVVDSCGWVSEEQFQRLFRK